MFIAAATLHPSISIARCHIPRVPYLSTSTHLFTAGVVAATYPAAVMKPLFLSIICACVAGVLIAPPARAADCIDGCIDVYTENGQLIIEGRKGSGPITKKVPAPKRVVKRAVKPKSAFKPPISIVAPKKVAKPANKPTKKVVRKKSTPKQTPSAESFADRLIKLLPTPGLKYQPGYEPLVRVPVYFSTGLPQSFSTVVDVVGERVNVQLTPHFHYDFGDGTTLDTTDVGGFYPDGRVTHTYAQPGEYNVRVDIVWGGVYITKGLSKAVRGAIELVVNAPITVVATTNRLMN